MADACLVVDVLGPDVRTHLIERYSAFELKEYRRIFRPSDEAGQLDNIARRFAWFRRLLQTHEVEQGRVFPPEWRVGRYLFAKFVEITRSNNPSQNRTMLIWYLGMTSQPYFPKRDRHSQSNLFSIICRLPQNSKPLCRKSGQRH